MATAKKAQPSITINIIFNDEATTLFDGFVESIKSLASAEMNSSGTGAIPQTTLAFVPAGAPAAPYVTPAPLPTEPSAIGAPVNTSPLPVAPTTAPPAQVAPAIPQVPAQTATPFNGGFAPLPTAAAPEITLEQIMRAGGQLVSQMATNPDLAAAVQEVLLPYGGTAMNIPKDQYGAVATRLRQLGAQI